MQYIRTISGKAKMLASLKYYRGPIYVCCVGANDVYYCQVTKVEIMHRIGMLEDGEVELMEFTDCIRVERFNELSEKEED